MKQYSFEKIERKGRMPQRSFIASFRVKKGFSELILFGFTP
jgi:hypothetical protein